MLRFGDRIAKNVARHISFKAWNKRKNDVKPKKARCALSISEGIIETCELPNGTRLVNECKRSEITTVGCFLTAGSLYEDDEERGSALFLEHLLFRRTKSKNESGIENELGKIGGKLGARATRDAFFFYGTAPSSNVEKLVELLGDATFNGLLCEEDLAKEKLIVLRYLEALERDHETVVMDYLPTVAYQNNRLSNSVYPSTMEMNILNAKRLSSFKNRLFDPCFMTVVSTGSASMAKMKDLVSRHFSPPACPEKTDKCFPKLPHSRFSGGELRLRDDEEKLGHVAIAVEGPGHKNCDDHCALTVAKEIVGSWSRGSAGGYHNAPHLAHYAFKSDLCEEYKSFNMGWRNTSLWGCYFRTKKLSLEDMQFAVQKEWLRICMNVGDKEVKRAVNQCKTQELLNSNDSLDRFFDIATCILHRGAYESLEYRLQKFEVVNAEVIRTVMDKYIYDQCPVVIALGPVENLPDYNRIRSFMYSLLY